MNSLPAPYPLTGGVGYVIGSDPTREPPLNVNRITLTSCMVSVRSSSNEASLSLEHGLFVHSTGAFGSQSTKLSIKVGI